MTREDAIEIVQSATVWTDEERDALAMLIPDLAESEDEKIRKEMIRYFTEMKKGGSASLPYDDCIAYLERQKEQKLTDTEWAELQSEFKNINEAFEDGKKEVIDNPEKYGLQKENKFAPRVLPCSAAWFENDDEEQKEQKPADDKAFEEWIDDWWKHNKVNNPDSYDKGDEIQFDERSFKNFCRGIRNMYQQEPAWSEEDEDKLEQCIRIVSGWEGDYDIVKSPYSNFLKSLRPQPHWMPSKEQMDALERCIDYLDESDNDDFRIMLTLYEQLVSLEASKLEPF